VLRRCVWLQLPQLARRQRFGLVAEPLAVGAQHTPGESLVLALELQGRREHLVDGRLTSAGGKLGEERDLSGRSRR
jgi:hypothetical protein